MTISYGMWRLHRWCRVQLSSGSRNTNAWGGTEVCASNFTLPRYSMNSTDSWDTSAAPSSDRPFLPLLEFTHCHNSCRPRSGTTINYHWYRNLPHRPRLLDMTGVICVHILKQPWTTALKTNLFHAESVRHESYCSTTAFTRARPPIRVCSYHRKLAQPCSLANA